MYELSLDLNGLIVFDQDGNTFPSNPQQILIVFSTQESAILAAKNLIASMRLHEYAEGSKVSITADNALPQELAMVPKDARCSKCGKVFLPRQKIAVADGQSSHAVCVRKARKLKYTKKAGYVYT